LIVFELSWYDGEEAGEEAESIGEVRYFCLQSHLLVCCLWREIFMVFIWFLVLRVLVSTWSKVLYYVVYSLVRVNVIRATETCLIGFKGLCIA
jgi:hypothetical protein